MLPRQHLFIVALFGVSFFLDILGRNFVDCHHIPQNSTPNKTLCRNSRLYFPPTQKCYQYGRKGPCGELMLLEASAENPRVGECKCVKSLCPSRPLIFVKGASRCYGLFHQGPCQRGEWLVVTKGNSVKCEQNPCLGEYNDQSLDSSEQSRDFVFAYEGKCYNTVERGQWNCSTDQFAYLDDLTFSPGCQPYLPCGGGGAGNSNDNDCEDGSAPDPSGGCSPMANL